MKQVNIIIGFCILAALYISTKTVHGKPNAETLQDLELLGIGRNRAKRQVQGILTAGIGLATTSILNAFECSETAGCNRGYCWGWCGVSLKDGEWCYTTKTYSQSFQYETCNQDSDCDRCWKCAGSCTL